jgi:carboxyl-terminal processing protease
MPIASQAHAALASLPDLQPRWIVMRMKHFLGLLGLCSMLVGLVVAAELPTHWSLTGTGSTYHLEVAGDPQSGQGAKLALSSSGGEPTRFGGAMTSVDATSFRLHVVRLSAELTTRDADGGAGIWLRADGPNGQLAFINSQDSLVKGTSPATYREVEIDVPATATRLVYGVLLDGNGEVTAEKLQLIRGAAVSHVSPSTVLDAAIRIVRTKALHSRDVDWNTVEPEIRAMAKDARDSIDVYPAIRAMLAKLGDHHSFLLDATRSRVMATEGIPSSAPVIASRPGGIGYIDMPGYSGTDRVASRAFAASMVGAISKTASDARCGWIVDLRRDGGGNMRPMLAGLRPLLGAGNLGSFRGPAGQSQVFYAGIRMDPVPTGPDLSAARVAVLTGPHTGSSGEVVAVAFRGRPNTRSFGAATAGLSSANTGFALPDRSMIFLTTAIDVDRNGHAYGGKLVPDQPVDSGATDRDDRVVDAATAWLQQSPACVSAGKSATP